jgi:hypothetical protein
MDPDAINFSTCYRVGKRTAWILIRRLVWINAGRKRTMLVLSWRGSNYTLKQSFVAKIIMNKDSLVFVRKKIFANFVFINFFTFFMVTIFTSDCPLSHHIGSLEHPVE